MWRNIDMTVSDKFVTEPIPTVVIPSKYPPVDIGPKVAPDNTTGPYIDTLNPARFEPKVYPKKYDLYGNEYPSVPVLYRNTWETFNTTNGKFYGGFDDYNIYDKPSFNTTFGAYKPYNRFYQPFTNLLVKHDEYTPVQYDSHA